MVAATTTNIKVLVVSRVYVRHVQEAVASDAEIDECGLNARLDVDDLAFVNIADVTFLTRPFDVKFFEDSIFENGDSAFLRLEDVDKHFLLHKLSFAKRCGTAFDRRAARRWPGRDSRVGRRGDEGW